MTNNSNQRKVWIAKEAASWGIDDPKISKPYLFAKEIVKHFDGDDATIDEVDFLADRLLDKLQSALMYYQLIAADDFDERNICTQIFGASIRVEYKTT